MAPSAPDADDPFALLGLPRRFDLLPSQIQSAYLARIAALHPDRFTNPVEQAEAERQAAHLNTAKQSLMDDEQRANVLLRLLGGKDKEQDKSLPQGFLMDMMDVRQRMEEALASGDPVQSARIEAWALNERNTRFAAVAAILNNSTGSDAAMPPDRRTALLAEARMHLNAWRYIERMIEQLDPDHRAPL